jgi:hypothetical protein
VVEATPRPLYPWRADIGSVLHAADWAPLLVRTCVQERNAFCRTWFEPQTLQPVAIHYTDLVTPDHTLLQIIIIIIITIIITTISFMQGIYTYILETNNVPKEYNFAAILSLLFMVPISLVPVLTL